MKEYFCPHCDSVVRTKFHKKCKNKDDMYNLNTPHLHAYCNECGADFILPKDKEEGVVELG